MPEWTKVKPRKDGFYWYLGENGAPATIVATHLFTDTVSFHGDDEDYEIEDLSGWWAGPITEPNAPESQSKENA